MVLAVVQLAGYLMVWFFLAMELGRYLTWIWRGGSLPGLRCLEQGLYRFAGIGPQEEMTAKQYMANVLIFSAGGILLLVVLLLGQGDMPLNPNGVSGLSLPLAVNTAVSFVTNTDWQAYSGERQLSYFSQAFGLTVQNFLSAGTGLAVCFAVLRGLARQGRETIGNFFVDLVRSILYVLLPFSIVLALLLVSLGVVQSLAPNVLALLAEPQGTMLQQLIPMGPAASQTAIQLLGSNGGGFFGANAAHPLVNPGPAANLLEMIVLLLLPAAVCFAFGRILGQPKQGRLLVLTLLAVLVLSMAGLYAAEQLSGPQYGAGLVQDIAGQDALGNMEGKEVRFGIAGAAFWTSVTTATSNGALNAALESFTPLGTLLALLNMQLGSVIFGGIGSGLYSMLAFVLLTVFITGLLVGRTPEFLGKKIGPQEMKLAVVICLAPTAAILGGCAFAAVWPGISGSLAAAGPHGFTELLYAYTSAGANNGSAMAGLQADHAVFHFSLALVMLIGRFVPLAAVLLLAGRLAQKPQAAASAGSLRTDTVLFGGLLLAVILLVGVLSFLPALALGPAAEFLRMAS